MKHVPVNTVSVDITKDTPINIVKQRINSRGREDKDDAFFVGDLGDIIHKYKLWKGLLPHVAPFYAVKCNDDPVVLEVLAQLGAGFDCASKAEIQKVLGLKVKPERIVYANPCKQNSHIRYAAKKGITMMTFDNETELHKIKLNHPKAELILRIAPPDDSKSQCQLGMKYGCNLKAVSRLLKVAKELDLNVIGVSFHVGSGCYDSGAYVAALALSRTVFDIAESQGFHFNLLDIGGGFPGQKSAKLSFEEICAVLCPAMDEYFPESMGVRVIAEPGRFFVASAFTLAVNVIAKRAVPRGEGNPADKELTANDEPSFMYYVNDGVYGSFNCLLYDHAIVEPTLIEDYGDEPTFTSSIWGPTCDGLDCITERCFLPELDDGDWIIFRDMGAYTMCAASNFNGMPKPRCFYIIQDLPWNQLNAKKCGSGLLRVVSEMKFGHEVQDDPEYHDVCPAITVLDN